MSLPKIEIPTFTTTLPSNKKEVKYRQYSVKEEKILLIAEQSKDTNDIVNAIKQVISNCLFTELDVDNLPIFDIEWLFLQLRSKSVGEIVEFKIQDFEDEKIYDLELNLDDVKIECDTNNLISLGKNLHIKLRYPSISEMNDLLKFDEKNPDHTIFIVAKIIDAIYDDETVYTPDSFEELKEFVEQFPKSTMLEIEKFFESIPRMNHSIKYKNSLGNERIFELKGLQDFFL